MIGNPVEVTGRFDRRHAIVPSMTSRSRETICIRLRVIQPGARLNGIENRGGQRQEDFRIERVMIGRLVVAINGRVPAAEPDSPV
jgi:hypothetical protein